MLLDIFDPKAPPKPVGIDLGTTNSIVASVRDGKPAALTTCDGTALLPSVVYYGDHGAVIVGGSAKPYAVRAPERTIASVKRFVGRGADDPQTRQLGTYRFVAPATDDEARTVRFGVGQRTVTPVEVSADILKTLKKSAEDQLKTLGGVVITVPAYFDDAQRQATKDAGRLAGLNVLRLLNEPTAAALAYGLEKRKNGVFAVYDLGGGTFDITILVLDDGVFQVKSTGGDSALGGDDMDRLIADRMLAAMGFPASSERPAEVVSLALDAARQAKHALTEAGETIVEIPKRGGGDTDFRLTREEFDAWITPLLERTGRSCRRALRDAQLTADQVDGVILVGGSTRVPAVRAYVAALFEQEPLGDIDPDLVVAYGAAVQADLLTNQSDEILLLDVLPLSLGVETMGGGVDRILPRNTTIPTGAKSVFTTFADRQTGFDIHVVQGERELAQDCRSLARFTLKGIPPMPAGMARLEVHFNVDENNLLEVRATEVTTGIEQKVEVKPSYGLGEDQIEDMLIEAIDHGDEDLEARRLADARVEAQRILLATEKALADDADLLSAAEREAVVAALSALRDAVQAAKRPGALQLKIDDLDRATHDWAGRRMDRAIQAAIAGKGLGEVAATVERAAGVDAHVEAHEQARAEREQRARGEG
jgi:molecular chaperone HscA